MRIPRLAVIETGADERLRLRPHARQGRGDGDARVVEGLDDRELARCWRMSCRIIRNGDARLGLIAAVFVGIISLGFDHDDAQAADRRGRTARRLAGGGQFAQRAAARRRWSGC